jgi:hypothetical protein
MRTIALATSVRYSRDCRKVSGELLDRAKAIQAQDEVESGQYDLVLTEDLGRNFAAVDDPLMP